MRMGQQRPLNIRGSDTEQHKSELTIALWTSVPLISILLITLLLTTWNATWLIGEAMATTNPNNSNVGLFHNLSPIPIPKAMGCKDYSVALEERVFIHQAGEWTWLWWVVYYIWGFRSMISLCDSGLWNWCSWQWRGRERATWTTLGFWGFRGVNDRLWIDCKSWNGGRYQGSVRERFSGASRQMPLKIQAVAWLMLFILISKLFIPWTGVHSY